jgi:hypothetical protein
MYIYTSIGKVPAIYLIVLKVHSGSIKHEVPRTYSDHMLRDVTCTVHNTKRFYGYVQQITYGILIS